MEYKEILDIIKTGEGLTIEFKESVNASLGKEMCAFANSQGGKIILGAKDTGEVKGFELSNKKKSRIYDIAKNIDPSLEIFLEQINDVVVIFVPDGKDKPYFVNGNFFMRQGANSQKLSRNDIRNYFQKENLISFERQTCGFNNKDFDEVAFKRFLSDSGLDKGLTKDHLFTNLNLITNEKINNAGVLFFTDKVKKYFPTATVNCFLYSDIEQTEILDSKEFSKDIVSNINEAYNFVLTKLNNSIKINGDLQHEEKLEIPRIVIREAIVNALIHKDYFVNSSVQINITPSVVEVINPGKLLFPESEFGKLSVRRNPIIVDLLHRLRMVEKAGSGIKRIIKITKKYDIKVDFSHKEFFRVVFYRKKLDSEANPKQIRSKSEANPKQNNNNKINREMRLEWIINYLKENKKIRSKDIENEFNIHRDTAIVDIKHLSEKIIKKGAGNNVWYELKQ